MIMKKVVIITECRRFRFNYGETLQAVALNRIISRLGFWCITASYENEKENFNDQYMCYNDIHGDCRMRTEERRTVHGYPDI